MCYPVCYEPTEGAMTCEDCTAGITGAVDQLLEAETLDLIVEYLQGDGLCAADENPQCPEGVAFVIRQGLPILRDSGNPAETNPMLCNLAVEGTCPARRRSIFKKRTVF